MCRSELMSRRLAPIAVALVALSVPAAAQDSAESVAKLKLPKVSRSAPPSPNATVNLINLLVKQGVLTEEQATALVKQADDEAYVARQAVRGASTKAEGAEKAAATATEATSPPGTKRITYIPEIVKKQLRDEIRKEVMEKAEKENWASPGKYPEWAQRIRFYGDVRVRHESDFFPKGNYPYSVNYNAINSGSPYNVLGGTASSYSNPYFWPTYNVDQDRQRERLRARLGMDETKLMLTFQSRFGRAEWLQPYTDKTVEALAQRGVKNLAVVCPGFAADCLETLEEIAGENAEIFKHNGGENFALIPCLNDSEAGMAVLHHLVLRELQGWV